jgi:hypothetical protein
MKTGMMPVNGEQGTLWQFAAMACFKMLHWHELMD